MSFHKVIFFLNIMLLRFIHIYICTFSLLCSIVFIHSLVGEYVDGFQFFPIISNVILDPFFYDCHRTLFIA